MSLKFLDLGDLLERGYFPKELPPPFNTALFADSVINSWTRYCDKFKDRCVTKPVNHSIPRVGRLRRKLSIPNPISFFQLSKEIAENKDDIDTILNPDPYSVTTPHVNDSEGRAVVPSKWFNELPRMRAKQRANARYLVKADVSKFYHSIYTHSIPWAIHGKAFAKTHRGFDYLGNRLDTYLRNGQDAQTVGIPIGPDTSLIVAEIILSQVDKEIASKHNLGGFRFVDDYEISCKNMAEVETAISALETALSRYELQLNPAKLKIIELPDDLDSQWATELRTIPLSEASPKSQYFALLQFINTASKYMKEHPDRSIAKYCLGRLARIGIHDENEDFVFDFLIHCFNLEPSSIPKVIELLCDRFSVFSRGVLGPVRTPILQQAAMQVLEKGIAIQHASEVAWALWTCIVFGLQIDEGLFAKVTEIQDSIVALIALDAHSRGIVDGTHTFPSWEPYLTHDNLHEEMWLLAYEAAMHGWLTPLDPNFIETSDQFKILKDDNVFFYDDTTDPVDLVPKLPDIEPAEDAPDFEPDWDVESLYF